MDVYVVKSRSFIGNVESNIVVGVCSDLENAINIGNRWLNGGAKSINKEDIDLFTLDNWSENHILSHGSDYRFVYITETKMNTLNTIL